MLTIAVALLFVVGGLTIAGLLARVARWEYAAAVIGGLASAFGGGWAGYAYVVLQYPGWVQINPGLDPWEGALWAAGMLVGGVIAAVIAVAIAWPRHTAIIMFHPIKEEAKEAKAAAASDKMEEVPGEEAV